MSTIDSMKAGAPRAMQSRMSKSGPVWPCRRKPRRHRACIGSSNGFMIANQSNVHFRPSTTAQKARLPRNCVFGTWHQQEHILIGCMALKQPIKYDAAKCIMPQLC